MVDRSLTFKFVTFHTGGSFSGRDETFRISKSSNCCAVRNAAKSQMANGCHSLFNRNFVCDPSPLSASAATELYPSSPTWLIWAGTYRASAELVRNVHINPGKSDRDRHLHVATFSLQSWLSASTYTRVAVESCGAGGWVPDRKSVV